MEERPMKECPACGEKTLKTKAEELEKINKSVEDGVLRKLSRIYDTWSLCSELCTSCGYVR